VYPLAPITSGEVAPSAASPTPLVELTHQVRLQAALEKLERAEAILAAVAAFKRRAL